jgi:hypothetical protein
MPERLCGGFAEVGSADAGADADADGPPDNGSWDWFVCANSEAVCSTSDTIRQCCHSTECSTTTFGSTCLDYNSCIDNTRNPDTYCW